MGSPLSAPMANIFLCFHERNWLENCPDEFRPLLYRRYVDDTFLLFKRKDQIEKFFQYLNSQHPNIRFTKEHENDNKISFLDMNITKTMKDNSFSFDFKVFRKMTFTGLGLNYHSFTYLNFKINSIKTLLFRAYKLCSNWQDVHNEIEFLLEYFKLNGYPEALIFNVINRFLSSIFKEKSDIPTVQKLVKYFKFPFLNNVCCDFIKKGNWWFLKT